MNAIGYIRRSAKADDSTASLIEQQAQIVKYCQANGLNLLAVVEHDGISGTKRTRFAAIESALNEHRAKHLIVYNLDRFARDVVGLLDYLRALSKRGIQVHRTDQGVVVNLGSVTGYMTTAVEGVFAELFPLMVSEKTRTVLAGKRARGERYSNIPPFGFEYVDGKLVSNPSEQRAITFILDQRQRGRTYRDIELALRVAGHRGRLSVMTVQRVCASAQKPPGFQPHLPQD